MKLVFHSAWNRWCCHHHTWLTVQSGCVDRPAGRWWRWPALWWPPSCKWPPSLWPARSVDWVTAQDLQPKTKESRKIIHRIRNNHQTRLCSMTHLLYSSRSQGGSSRSSDPRWPSPPPWLHICGLEAAVVLVVLPEYFWLPPSAERSQKMRRFEFLIHLVQH